MEKFKGSLKKRLAIMGGFNGLAILFIVLTAIYGNRVADGSQYVSDMIRGFQIGIFIGLQMLVLVLIGKYIKALKYEDEMKKLYIEENDERRKLIQDKIGGSGYNFILGVVGTVTVIAGFFHQIVFITLLGVLIFIVLVKGTLKIYYRNKF